MVLKNKLLKQINKEIFEIVSEYFSKRNLEIIKLPDSFSFSITSPRSENLCLLITNIPESSGFVQIQIIDDRLPLVSNLRIINCLENLICLIEEFITVETDSGIDGSEISSNLEDSKDYPDIINFS